MKKYNFISFLICLIIFTFNSNAEAPAADIIVIDSLRNLQVNENTTLTIDRREFVEQEQDRAVEQFGTGLLARMLPGFKARINYTYNGSPANGGDLDHIGLLNSVVGPVTDISETSLQVLLVDMTIDGDTVIAGIDDISDLQLGDIVAVSGMESDAGVVMATRVEYFSEPNSYWLITGDVNNLSSDGFAIGNQQINTDIAGGDVPFFCDNGVLEEGLKVIVDLTPKDDYVTGDILDATGIVCYEDFEPPIGPNDVFFNGDIEQVNAGQTQIVVDGRTVNITNDTEIVFEDGSTSLEVGQNVTVQGSHDDDSNEVTAQLIIVNDDSVQPPQTVGLVGEVSVVTPDSFAMQGMIVQRNSDTVYIDGVEADLVDGSLIELVGIGSNDPSVPGFLALQITFIDDLPPGHHFVRLTGEISGLNAGHTEFALDGETIDVDEDTIFVGTTAADLENGQTLLLEGFRDNATNHVLAKLLVSGTDTPPAFVGVSGLINTVNADRTQLSLDDGTTINVSAETNYIDGEQTDLVVGAFVEIAGIVNAGSTEVEAKTIYFTAQFPPSFVFFNGFITDAATDGSQITVDDTVVNISENTDIQGGTVANLVIGTEVQIDGLYNSSTDEVDAELITIPVATVAAAAAVLPEDITLSDAGADNGILLIMGMEVHQNELTWDFSDIFTNGISEEQNIVFFGYQDNDGVIWASTVFASRDGGPNGGNVLDEIFLHGKVTNLDTDTLSVMAVNIGNLSGATYLDNGAVVTEAEFMADLSEGDQVSINDAQSYDRVTNTLNAGVISKFSNDSGNNPANRVVEVRGGENEISGSGIVTKIIEDVIYRESF